MGRRGNGEGSATYDKSKGLWYGRWTRPNGTRGKTRGYQTELEALQRGRDLDYEERHGLRSREQNHRRTVGDVFDAWSETVVSQKEPPTQRDYEGALKQLRPHFAKRVLEDLSRLDVQRYANGLRKRLRYPTVRKQVTVLSMALEQAKDWGWITGNVARDITIKKDADASDEVDALTDEESDKLLAAAQGRSMEYLLTVGLWTGMRKGELGGLRWSDIDSERGRVRVSQTLVWLAKSPWYFKPRPKTRAGRRSFPILPVVAEALEAQQARVAQLREAAGDLWTDYDLVFPTEIGTPIHPGNINHETIKVEQLAGVEHHRIHDWRHTAATKMLHAGVPDRVVMDVCGWTDRSMLDRYQHVHDEHLDEMVELMVERYPAAAGSGLVRLPVRSKYAARPHSRQKGARLAP